MTASTVEQLILELQNDGESEQLALELQALQSIYSEEDAIVIWKPEPSMPMSSASPKTVRLDVRTALSPPHDTVEFRLLVSVPPTYPASSPPQLQLLSRYIGPFQVDAELFATVLKTYMSTGRVEFVPGEVAIFDGIENVREAIQQWYEEHRNAATAAELQREDERAHALSESDTSQESTATDAIGTLNLSDTAVKPEFAVKLPDGVQVFSSEPVHDRKSTFIGHACAITHPFQVPIVLAHLLEDKNIARATHPVINAWRCEVDGILHNGNDDDGETAAGSRLAHLLQILDLRGILVVVTRYFGGIHLHGDRFRHINSVARAALEEGGFLDGPEDLKRNARTGAKAKRKA